MNSIAHLKQYYILLTVASSELQTIKTKMKKSCTPAVSVIPTFTYQTRL